MRMLMEPAIPAMAASVDKSDVLVSAVMSTYLLTHLHHVLQRAELSATREGRPAMARNYAKYNIPKHCQSYASETYRIMTDKLFRLNNNNQNNQSNNQNNNYDYLFKMMIQNELLLLLPTTTTKTTETTKAEETSPFPRDRDGSRSSRAAIRLPVPVVREATRDDVDALANRAVRAIG